MIVVKIAALLALTAYANASIYLHSVSLKGEPGPYSTNGLRQLKEPITNPIVGLTDPLLTCNAGLQTPAAVPLVVNAGETLTFQYLDSLHSSAHVLNGNERGTCRIHISAVDPNTRNPTNWTLFAQSGYDPATKNWCTDILKRTGKFNVGPIWDLPAGRYVYRIEISPAEEIVKNVAVGTNIPDANFNNAKFWVRCLDVDIRGSGSVKLPTNQSIAIPSAEWSQGYKTLIQNGFNSSGFQGPPSIAPKVATDKFSMIDGKKVTWCVNTQPTKIDQFGRKWGFENNQTCIIHDGLATPQTAPNTTNTQNPPTTFTPPGQTPGQTFVKPKPQPVSQSPVVKRFRRYRR
ncbi:hypothetical protein BKA69DRAFT_1125954 [Paraphysoderma sedebokerense]|nr:hypothetical protein BKA69DRAFT_1125954 [Paraphysoderma sedebokerense]